MKLIIAAAFAALTLQATGVSAEENKPHWASAADNKIFAQTLVNETMKANPDLLGIGVHAAAPGTDNQKVVASNKDKIGKPDKDKHIQIVKKGITVLEQEKDEPDEYEVSMPLKAANGDVVGAITFEFKCDKDPDEVKLFAKALELRNSMAKRIDDKKALFAIAK